MPASIGPPTARVKHGTVLILRAGIQSFPWIASKLWLTILKLSVKLDYMFHADQGGISTICLGWSSKINRQRHPEA